MSDSARPIRVGGEEIGAVAVFEAGDSGEPWSYLGVENADLAVASVELAKGTLKDWQTGEAFRIPTTTLEGLFSVGPTHDLIGHLPGREPIGAFEFHGVGPTHDLIGHLPGRDPRGAFEFHPLEGTAKDMSLWAANCKTQKRLIVQPTHKGIPVRKELAQRMRAKKSKLLYQRGIQWTSQRLLAATTIEPVLGGSAWTALHGEERLQKAFALWANSIIGFLVHWTQGQRTQNGRSRTQIGALRKIPCPNLARIPIVKLEQAARDFDELAKLELKPACQAHCDENRRRIDEAVCQMLSIPEPLKKTIDKLRRLWCAEPSVHGNNKTVLKLLTKPSD